MNRNYSWLLSVAVLFAALPTFNLGASGATAVGANVSGTAPDSGRGTIVAIDGGASRKPPRARTTSCSGFQSRR